jgi:phage tail-like protein
MAIGRSLVVGALLVLAASAVQEAPARADKEVMIVTLEIGGLTLHFSGLSGLSSESDIVEQVMQTNTGQTVVKQPGPVRFHNLVLTRRFNGNPELQHVRQAFLQGKLQKGPATVTVTLPNGGTYIWKLMNGWPVKWSGPDFDAGKNDLQIETIEIAHEGLDCNC